MTTLKLPARMAGLFAVAVTCLLLAGCVLASKTNLITTAELAWPFAGDFTLFPYNDAEDGNGLTPSKDGPKTFAKGVDGYTSEELTLQFVKIADDTYLVGAGGGTAPSELYGVTMLREGIASTQMIFTDALKDNIEAIKAKAPADIAADIAYSDGGIEISKRATLDYIIGLIREGSLATEPIVAYLAADPKATTPARLVSDGANGFKAAN